jgi:hypothetical protein
VPGDLLDVILVVLAAAFAVDGYRQGFVVGALGVIGFLSGAAAGALLAPGIAQSLVRSPSQQALVAIVVVFQSGLHAAVALRGQVMPERGPSHVRAARPATSAPPGQAARRQRPVKAGGRFSAKARWPSR